MYDGRHSGVGDADTAPDHTSSYAEGVTLTTHALALSPATPTQTPTRRGETKRCESNFGKRRTPPPSPHPARRERPARRSVGFRLRQVSTVGARRPMAGLSQHQCNTIAHKINTRPRKRLGFKTPLECYNES